MFVTHRRRRDVEGFFPGRLYFQGYCECKVLNTKEKNKTCTIVVDRRGRKKCTHVYGISLTINTYSSWCSPAPRFFASTWKMATSVGRRGLVLGVEVVMMFGTLIRCVSERREGLHCMSVITGRREGVEVSLRESSLAGGGGGGGGGKNAGALRLERKGDVG